MNMATEERLGHVKLPCGQVLIVDTGLLNLWRHDGPPLLPDGVLSPESTALANDAQDFRIDGPDAARAGQLLDRQRTLRWVFDMPRTGVPDLERAFAEVVRTNRLDAHLVPVVPRVAHVKRARIAIEQDAGGAGEILVHGVPMVAAGNLPRGVVPIVGERRGIEPYADNWDWVGMRLSDAPISQSRPCGDVGVDWARLMFVDLEALAHWQHDDPLDGRADFVFWGRDAEAAAKRFGAPRVDDSSFGFIDLPIDEVVARGEGIEAAKRRGEYRMATNFRPHTQHYQLLAQMRASPTESGCLALGDSTCCAFFTSWGDGIFPVFRDLSASGELVRLRIQLGTEQAIQNLDHVNGR